MKDRIVINDGEGNYIDLNTVMVPANLTPQLLRIELDSITSVPRVYYNGVEVTKKVRVYFDWQTADVDIKYDSPVIRLEFLPDNPIGDMKTEVIEHRGKANAVKE